LFESLFYAQSHYPRLFLCSNCGVRFPCSRHTVGKNSSVKTLEHTFYNWLGNFVVNRCVIVLTAKNVVKVEFLFPFSVDKRVWISLVNLNNALSSLFKFCSIDWPDPCENPHFFMCYFFIFFLLVIFSQ
jgi:hypothetical protein